MNEQFNIIKMKKILSLLIALVISVSIFAQDAEVRDLREFDRVIVYDGITVQLVPSDKYSVKVSGAYIDKMSTQVSGNTLKIKMNFGSSFKGEDNHVIVYYDNKLYEIKACEGSSITSNEVIKADNLILSSKEGADIDLKIKAKDLTSKSYTGGNINVEGKTKNSFVEVYTGGKFDGIKLEAQYGEVKVNAGGRAEVTVEDVLDASVTMGGNIYYYGKTKSVNQSVSLGGKIESR